MKWQEERLIDAPIDVVWELFKEEQATRIMPKVVENRWIDKKPEMRGSTYEQTYIEGKRKETYPVEIVEFEDSELRKHKRIQFKLAHAFEMNLVFSMEKVSEHQTKFIYAGENRGINFVGRAMLKLGSGKNGDKVVHEFMDRVEQESLRDTESTSI